MLQINLNSNIKQSQSDNPYCTYFLFINSGSGGGLGVKLVNQQIRKISFEIPIENEQDIRLVDVYFINMRKNKQFGFNQLKKLNKNKYKTVAIVCGGDGTVIWVVSQFANFGINPLETPIAVIPLGTGNDFSRNLGWGGEKKMLIQYNYRSLKKLIRKWIHAKEYQFDIWDVSAQIFPDGKFQKVEKGQDVVISTNIYKKAFANYFSFGIDGKIGYSFDMHRTESRMGNYMMYGAIGAFVQATRSKTIDELIESFYVVNQAHKQSQNVCVFKSKLQSTQKTEDKQDNKTQYIVPGLKNILALNIDSYAGGVKGIWDSAKQIFNQVKDRSIPSFSDSKLQIVSFQSGTAIALERSIGGFANRIAQHGGPFIFNFRQYPDDEKYRKHRTYLQIDGQFIRFTKPKKVVIEKSKLVKNGKILVLKNDPQFVPYIPEEK